MRKTPYVHTDCNSFLPMATTLNRDLRLKIAHMVKASGEGHIPSSYSIVDIIEHLYAHVLHVDAKNP